MSIMIVTSFHELPWFFQNFLKVSNLVKYGQLMNDLTANQKH